jgi:uncharacterized membrane protein
MIHSFLIGLTAGARSLTPLAVVSEAARRGALPADSGAPSWLGHPLVAAGSKALAAGELFGDKMKSAPDRIVPAGLIARVVCAGIAGAALAPRRHAMAGAVLAAGAAVGAAYLTFNARIRAMRRFGQTPTGLVEDALTVGAAGMVMRDAAVPPARASSRSARVPAVRWPRPGSLRAGGR